MNSKTIDKGNYRIHTYKTDKFKTIDLHVTFTFEAKEDQYLVNAVKKLISYTCKKYRNRIDRYIKGEELYDEFLYLANGVDGTAISFTMNASFIDPKLVNDDYSEEAINYLFDVLNEPVFDEKDLEYVKNSLKEEYSSMVEHPDYQARRNADKNFYDDPRAYSEFVVDDKTIDSITMEQIKNKYNEIVNSSNIDVFLLGNIEDKYIDYIDKRMKFKSANKSFDLYFHTKELNKPIEIVETKKDLAQAQIVKMFNIKKFDNEENLKLVLYSLILGYGMNSKLFQIVREKYHLCYNINTYLKTLDGCLVLFTSVDNKNIKKAMKAIDEAIDDMKNIDKNYVEQFKQTLYSQLDGVYDSLYSIFSELYDVKVLNRLTCDEKRKIIKDLTVDDVLFMHDKYKLHNTYILKGE